MVRSNPCKKDLDLKPSLRFSCRDSSLYLCPPWARTAVCGSGRRARRGVHHSYFKGEDSMHIRSLSGFPVRTFLVVFAAVFVCSSFANAQGGADFMLGFQPYYQYDFFEVGNINTVNGMINMDIPLISYQQRGTLPPLRLSASYSGSRWQRYSDGN